MMELVTSKIGRQVKASEYQVSYYLSLQGC